jgi:hypothetical protein
MEDTRTDTQADRQQGGVISLLFFFRNKEIRLKMGRKGRLRKGRKRGIRMRSEKDEEGAWRNEPCRLSFGFAVLPIAPSYSRVCCTHVLSP